MAHAKQRKDPAGEKNSAPRQASEPQVNEDLSFQRRDWIAQRMGWAMLALLLLAGLLGLTGSGPLSHVTRGDGRQFTIEYDRFVRHGAKTSMTLRAEPGSITGSSVRITVDRGFLAANDLQRLVPEPNATRGRDDVVEFVYDVAPGAGLQARWTLEPDEIGSHTATVRLDEGPPIEVRQFTYP